jgi:hypothetical protein
MLFASRGLLRTYVPRFRHRFTAGTPRNAIVTNGSPLAKQDLNTGGSIPVLQEEW